MRVMRIALVASIALNLLVLGVLVGMWLDRGPDRDPRLRIAGPMAPFAAALEPEDRGALLAALRGEARERMPGPEAFRARFEALLDAIRAEPFDRERLEAVFAEQRALAVVRQSMGESLLIDRIAGLTVDERASYADRLRASFRRPRRR